MDWLSDTVSFSSTVLFISIFIGLILIVLWAILPFSIIGIKPMLKKIIQQQESIKYLLEQMRRESNSEKKIDPASLQNKQNS